MSKSQNSRVALCGNCKHFVAGGLCTLVKGQINSNAICDLHEFGSPHPIDTKVDPQHTKTETNYKIKTTETMPSEIVQKAIQMEHQLLSRGVPEEEAHRAVLAYFSGPEPPPAMPWPGPITGLDLAGRISSVKVPDTGEPLTNFRGLPENVEAYPTPNVSPYGIGSSSQPYQSFLTPDPNSVNGTSQSYQIVNNPAVSSSNWLGLASDPNSEPSMHGEYGFNVASMIPTFPDDYEALHSDKRINSISIPPSGVLAEASKDEQKKKYLELLAKWSLLLGGATAINSIVKNYLDSGTDKPLQVIGEYNYHGHDNDDECANYSGKRFNLLETHNRPVIPSEKLGYTTTHPNCKCTWDIKEESYKPLNKVTKSEQNEIDRIENHITKAAKDGTLHKIKPDGKLSKNTTHKNPLKELHGLNLSMPKFSLDLPRAKKGIKTRLNRKALQEAVTNLRSEFDWLTDDYIFNAKKLAEEVDGKLYLIRAAGETITDHTGEGEPYRRKLSADELNSMARTAIGKSMDINHQPEFETDATILDVEFDKQRKEMQMLVVERDPEINQAIDDGKISAVSINGGMPRNERVEPCDHNCTDNSCELCLVPQGVVLGELDGIGMTWVVTDPNGLYWNGHFVKSAEPGVKFTKIEPI